MSDFSDILHSPDHIKSYTAFNSGASKGFLYIEDITDKLFWDKLVNTVCPGRYEVKPYSQPEFNGKRKLEKEYHNLNKDFIVGVDGDFDFVCPLRHDRAQELNKSPFVIHTYSYSLESHRCCPESVSSLLQRVFMYQQCDNQFELALRTYSIHIHDALCLFAYLHNKNWQQYPENIFTECIALPAGAKILNQDLKINAGVMEHVSQNVNAFIETYKEHVTNEAEFTIFKAELNDRGVTPETAYLFIKGHYLMDNIFKPAFKLVVKANQRSDIGYVVANTNAASEAGRRQQVLNHYKNNCNVDTLIFQAEEYVRGAYWQKMIKKMRLACS